MNTQTNNLLLNLVLIAAIIASGLFIITRVITWESRYVTQSSSSSTGLAEERQVSGLRDHISGDLYVALEQLYQNFINEPIASAVIQEGSYTQVNENRFTLRSDGYSTGSTYTIAIDSQDGSVSAGCSDPEDRLDDAWICPETTDWTVDVTE